MLHVIIDGANVVGSQPDGWWRDRAGAARRLAGRLVAALVVDADGLAAALFGVPGPDDSELRVHLVLEGAARSAADLPTHPGLDVHLAAADGDAAIAALAGELAGPVAAVLVVTADRELIERARRAGAATLGPGALLRALPGPPS